MTEPQQAPSWARWTLVAAAAYNLLWGAFVVLAPNALFTLFDMPVPSHPGIWQCVGMIVGVYGVGYACAALSPYRHWPIVLVGLLGKILGPIGFVQAAWTGQFPWRFGWTILTNDLVWWLPFLLILRGAWSSFLAEAGPVLSPAEGMAQARTQSGDCLAALSRDRLLLVVFLRHLGCTFCRETVQDVAEQRDRLEAEGVLPVFVHQGDDGAAAALLAEHGLEGAARIQDPERSLYRAFSLQRGRLAALFGPRVWWRGFVAGVLHGHGVGKLDGDGFQMGGVFLVKDAVILRSFRHRSAADRPDYRDLALTEGLGR